MKLPKKKYVPKHNNELRAYAKGWNHCLERVEDLIKIADDEPSKEDLLAIKEHTLKRKKEPFYKGEYDCIVETEKLNELGD